ncbi:Cyanate permease [Reichenbachiella agariperforans]|uniref:Cyanate permease n=1 Tax=Reichenbachiella agariperforans TaxID=156994 RepID=A0A1M6P8P7_REIAG|nr:MFS transporter [Reichenbachiella agariperforans]SHK04331.1 Cyanate permease [Reichenbachiella agariperforans]
MQSQLNKNRLFIASCFALLTTAFAFGIRAGIMNDLVADMSLTDRQLGWINFMGIFGFPIATLIGGPLYNTLGPRKIGNVAFICHFIGITFSILSNSFYTLFFSTFFISFANGMVEAAYNPMIASMYTEKRATMLNRFHVWFPGGIAIGSILALLVANIGWGWQLKLSIMYIPAIIYFVMFRGQKFPETRSESSSSTAENFKAILKSPIYWVMLICMALTATTELGTQSWVERILANSGAQPLLVLAMVTVLMAVGRFFAGPLIHRLNITGVLLSSAVIASVAIYLMSIATGGMVYFAAILFAIGVCYFWPTMISFIAEYQPKTGALGMSLIGGVGMLGLSIFQPIIGGWIEGHRATKAAEGLTGEALELAAGQATLANIAIIPMLLIGVFLFIFFWQRKQASQS